MTAMVIVRCEQLHIIEIHDSAKICESFENMGSQVELSVLCLVSAGESKHVIQKGERKELTDRQLVIGM